MGSVAPVATVEVDITRVACAGAATAYVLRKLGKQAGAYTPGLIDRLFFELVNEKQGGDMASVATWFQGRAAELARLGHRVGARMVAFRTTTVLDWVAAGSGHRGAVLVTAGDILHPGAGIQGPHAVAVAYDPTRRSGRDALTAVDPWPGIGRISPPPKTLEGAHQRCLYRTFLLYSYGWS